MKKLFGIICVCLFSLFFVFSAIQAMGDEYVFKAKWGSLGKGNGQFDWPCGVAINNNNGYVYVADKNNHRIQKFDMEGKFINSIGKPGCSAGDGNGEFRYPAGVCVDENGNLYVADTNNDRIQVFDKNEIFINKWGKYGSGKGEFKRPVDVAANGGKVAVAEPSNQRIQLFTQTGTYIGQAGDFKSPMGLATNKENNVYISDLGLSKIIVCNSSLNKVKEWGSNGGGDGQFRANYGLAVDQNGNVYVVDAANFRVQKFDSSGKYLDKFGNKNQFKRLYGIAVNKEGKTAYVTDPSQHCVQKFILSEETIPACKFADPNLENAVRIKLNKLAGELTKSDLESLASLTAKDAEIKNLSGIECCINLKSLNFDTNQIWNLQPLAGLTGLQTLDLSKNQIKDIAPLAGLASLEFLSLLDNQIEIIAPLAGLQNLKSLYLNSNKIENISPLKGLSKLETLYLAQNAIKDIGTLVALDNLKDVTLFLNPVNDLSPLISNKGMGEGDKLFLNPDNNQIQWGQVQQLINNKVIVIPSEPGKYLQQ